MRLRFYLQSFHPPGGLDGPVLFHLGGGPGLFALWARFPYLAPSAPASANAEPPFHDLVALIAKYGLRGTSPERLVGLVPGQL